MTIESKQQTDVAPQQGTLDNSSSSTLVPTAAAPDEENPYYHLVHNDTSVLAASSNIIVMGVHGGTGSIKARGYRHASFTLGKPPQLLLVSNETWSGLNRLLVATEKKRKKRVSRYFAFHFCIPISFWVLIMYADETIPMSFVVIMVVLLFLRLRFDGVPRAQKAAEEELQDAVNQMQTSFTSEGYRISVGRGTTDPVLFCCSKEIACLEFERIGSAANAVV